MSFNARAILIDDEIEATNLLEILLKEIPEVEVIGAFNDPILGFNKILALEPDILFLDLEMPNLSGLQILELIQSNNSHIHVVVITAHEKLVLKAARYSLMDYLLKPVSRKELKVCIEKYKNHVSHHINGENKKISKFLDFVNDRIIIPSSFEEYIFKSNEILFLEADINYTRIYSSTTNPLTSSYNLGVIQKLLPKEKFCRISRKHIINLNHLKRINKRQKKCVVGNENIELSYSREYFIQTGLI